MADLKRIFKRINGLWVRQTAYQKQNGGWVKIGNATDSPFTLSGTWIWNENPVRIWEEQSPLYAQGVNQKINFTSNGKSFTRLSSNPMSLSRDGYIDYTYSGGYVIVYRWDSTDGDRWTSDAYRTITFTTPQAVSERFYTWFTANATYMLDGTWLFNEKLSFPDWGYVQDLSFISNNTQFDRIVFQINSSTTGYLRYVQRNANGNATSNSKDVYDWESDGSGWGYSRNDGATIYNNFRTITFTQAFDSNINKSFYKWFIANATKVYEIK